MKKTVTFTSADDKCKVMIGEPKFLVAPVNHGKKVTVASQTVKVANNNFSKVSIIPDAVLTMIHQSFKECLNINSIII